MIAELRNKKLTAIGIACNFARRLVQPIKDRAHPGCEFEGREDATREAIRDFQREEMAARLKPFFKEPVTDHEQPRPFSLKRPAPLVSHPPE